MKLEDVVNGTYEIVDGLVNVEGNVDLSHNNLTEIPWKFGTVSRHFSCSYNKLTSLEGCPKTVGGYFSCSGNQLTSLEGCPETVGGDFFCSFNQLTSLKGCPKTVGANFYCDNNKLTSLEGCPKEIGRSFSCYNNPIYDKIKELGGWKKYIEREQKVKKTPSEVYYINIHKMTIEKYKELKKKVMLKKTPSEVYMKVQKMTIKKLFKLNWVAKKSKEIPNHKLHICSIAPFVEIDGIWFLYYISQSGDSCIYMLGFGEDKVCKKIINNQLDIKMQIMCSTNLNFKDC